jgi:hypothetical protein
LSEQRTEQTQDCKPTKTDKHFRYLQGAQMPPTLLTIVIRATG